MDGDRVVLPGPRPGGSPTASPGRLAGMAVLLAGVGFFGTRSALSGSAAQLGHVPTAPVAALTPAVATGTVAVASMAAPAHTLAAEGGPHVLPAVASRAAALADAAAVAAPDALQLALGLAAAVALGFVAWLLISRDAYADQSKTPIDVEVPPEQEIEVSPSGIAKVGGYIATSPKGWKLQADTLKARGVRSVSGAEVVRLAQGKNVAIVDVRLRYRFEQFSIPGSVNVPLFQPIDGWAPFKTLRRIQFALFAVEGTECNPTFMQELLAKVPRNKELIFVDDSIVATLQPTKNCPDGKAGHAYMAMYRALNSGFRNKMRYLEGGIIEYEKAGGEYVVA
eukprot:EG_transcript_14553